MQQLMEIEEYRVETGHPDEVADAASQILSICEADRIFAIYGSMGAGKTTLVKAMCEQLGSHDIVTSPTFAIVNEYACPSNTIYHFDFYRIRDIVEAYDIGFEEYLESGGYCFIEWPEMIAPLLPSGAASLRIDITGPESRTIVVHRSKEWERQE